MINCSNLLKRDLTLVGAISLETAGFIGNKNSHYYGFIYMFILVLFNIFIISVDTVKKKNIWG